MTKLQVQSQNKKISYKTRNSLLLIRRVNIFEKRELSRDSLPGGQFFVRALVNIMSERFVLLVMLTLAIVLLQLEGAEADGESSPESVESSSFTKCFRAHATWCPPWQVLVQGRCQAIMKSGLS
uniref:(northern house mosquito) hypothetical protein n=1 Tax=Culex pipiens TaxID=7175 RepID=A0A8D8BQQ6_CULPI